MSAAAVIAATEKVLGAALRVLTAERAEPHGHHEAELEYAHEMLALAARDLAEATEASDSKPVGWDRTDDALEELPDPELVVPEHEDPNDRNLTGGGPW